MPFDKKAYMKAYRQANKEKIAAQQKAHDEANKEKIAAQRKARYEANKEKVAAQAKAWNEANKDKKAARQKAYYDANKNKIAAYLKTEQGRKNNRTSGWRRMGVNNVTDELYDYYMNCSNCEACGKEFTETIKRFLDHDHDTGDFRYVLCASCNTHDNWKIYITAI